MYKHYQKFIKRWISRIGIGQQRYQELQCPNVLGVSTRMQVMRAGIKTVVYLEVWWTKVQIGVNTKGRNFNQQFETDNQAER